MVVAEPVASSSVVKGRGQGSMEVESSRVVNKKVSETEGEVDRG
jgi:hypothetical protein